MKNWKEALAVLAVGAAVSLVAVNAPVVRRAPWIFLGAGLYGLGYYVAQQRPTGGWPMLKG